MPNAIPARAAIYDPFEGYVIRFDERFFLTTSAPNDADIIAQGAMIVRYGIRYLGKPHRAIVPELVALDYGDMFSGESAWDFLMKKSNLYPRADVVGHTHDGADEMIPVKMLDIVLPVMVLVYDSPNAHVPLANPIALLSADTAHLPERLCAHLPVYPTLSDWAAQQHE